uniref:HTH cro/C1-type domain-containing protein n=1 Tax=Mycobacterium riyadhense TaxID=486698 RepID=A0A653EW55_9MYCO|nr:hypothetical protein BIN_B_04190 [Mycobacterium riyadhense]
MTDTEEAALKRVGQAVADRRIEVGLTSQRELAEAANVALSTAALLERGKTFPRPANRALIEDALQWPRGALEALRRNGSLPAKKPAPAVVRTVAPAEQTYAAAPASGRTQILAIAKGLSDVAATCTQVLLTYGTHPEAQAALRELDAQLLNLESLIAASLPHAGAAFGETMSALAALHEHRDAIRTAATPSPPVVAGDRGGV